MRLTLLLCLLLGGAVGAPAVAGLRLPFARSSPLDQRRMVLGDWRLDITTGKFSGDKRCRLADRKHGISYAGGALGFHFGHHANTLGAWVKIDDGAALRWRDDLPELTRLGVPMDGASLDNPTDSIVWIPARQLDDANRITIQPSEARRPVTFHLRGFAGLRDIAREMGCTPEQRFVR